MVLKKKEFGKMISIMMKSQLDLMKQKRKTFRAPLQRIFTPPYNQEFITNANQLTFEDKSIEDFKKENHEHYLIFQKPISIN
jgi:hypothetical protein